MGSGIYTSIRRLVLPYESMWCILGKFRLINHISPAAIKKILKNELKDSLFHDVYPYRLTRWNYNNTFVFRADIISSLTSIPVEEMLTHQLTTVINIEDLQWLSWCYYLQYCPSCLAKGYHSIFHQLSFFERCPIHDEKLTTACSHCKVDYNYELVDAPVVPFICPRCHTSVWSRYARKGGVLIEQLLRFSPAMVSALNDLFEWLVTFKTSPLVRQRFTEVLSEAGPDLPRISAREIYSIWHDTGTGYEIPSLAEPLSASLQHNSVYFGSHTSAKMRLFCMAYTLGRYSKWMKRGSRWATWKSVSCEDGSSMLAPIYKAIRRHEFKQLNRNGVRCPIPGYAARSVRIPEQCRGCKWAMAYVLWREYWGARLADSTYCWLDIEVLFKDVVNPRVAKWAGLWLFSLQCLWELRQAIFLIEGQGISSIDSGKILRGDFSFTWVLEESAHGANSIFHYWTKSLSYNQTFACRENFAMKRTLARRTPDYLLRKNPVGGR